MKKDWKKRVEDLRNVHAIATSPGNYDVDDYMLGMANGLILALAIMEDKDPEYLRGKGHG
jgi:hypothetical protein